MKFWKRILAGVLGLSVCASLAGCSRDSAKEGSHAANMKAPMGRWVETQPLAQAAADLAACYFLSAPTQMADGSLWLLGTDRGESREGQTLPLYRWTSNDDGVTWNQETLDWPEHTGGIVQYAALRPDGAAFVQSTDTDWNYRHWLRTATGEYIELPLRECIPGFYGVHDAWLLEGDILALNPEWVDRENAVRDDLLFYDIAAETVVGSAKAGGDSVGALTGSDGTPVTSCALVGPAPAQDGLWLLYQNAAAGRSELARVSTGGEISSTGVEIPGSAYDISGAADVDGNYYYCSGSGICRIAAGGSLIEQLVDGDSYSFGVSDNYGLCRTDKNSFLIAAYVDAGTSIYRYAWDETLPAAGFGDSLRVWSLRENNTVRAAIVELGKTRPDIDVTYTVAISDENRLTEDDAIAALNTELLAGNGPDVLILDGTDYQSMAAQGLLADLDGMVKMDNLLPNIAGPFADGPVTVLPARFSLPVLYGGDGSMTRVDTLDKLAAAAAAAAPRPDFDATEEAFYRELPQEEWYAFSMLDAEMLLSFALQTCEPALLDGGAVNEVALVRFYTFIKTVGDGLGMRDYRSASEHTRTGGAASWYNSDTVLLADGFYEYGRRALYGWDEMATPAMLAVAEEVMIRPGLVEGAYLPSTLAGVSAASQHPEQAAALIAAIFSPEVQGSDQEDGMPVLAAAMEQSLSRNRKCIEEGPYTGDVWALIQSAKTPVLADQTLYAKLLPHARAVITGSETPEQAAQDTVQDLALMMAEK